MRKIIFALLLIFPANYLLAQTTLRTAEPFTDQESTNKILLLNNGYTFLLSYSEKKGAEVIVYNNDRKKISNREVKEGLWDPLKMNVNNNVNNLSYRARMFSESLREPSNDDFIGFYEINGKPTLFVTQIIDKRLSLIRIVFDATSGEVLSEDKLADLPKDKLRMLVVIRPHGFLVVKDQFSDCYAIAKLDNQTSDKAKDYIEVIHYDGNNKEINRAFLNSEQYGSYQTALFLQVHGDKDIYMGIQGFEGNLKQPKLLIGRLENGKKTFEIKLVNPSASYESVSIKTSQKSNDGIVELLFDLQKITNNEEKHVKSTSLLITCNMNDFSLSGFTAISDKTLVDLSHKTNSKPFFTIPYGVAYNNNNKKMIFEEERLFNVINSPMSSGTGTAYSKSGKELKDIGIINLDEHNQVLGTYAISRFITTNELDYERAFFYLTTENNLYVLLNDESVNKKSAEGKPKEVRKKNLSNLACYKLDNTTLQNVFSNQDLPYMDISSLNYNKTLKICAGVLIDDVDGTNKYKVGWMLLD